MADSHSTATPEATKASAIAHPPVPDVQKASEPEIDRSEMVGARAIQAIGGGSPETPPQQYAGALGQLSGRSQAGMLRQLQRSYGNQYVGAVIQRKGEGEVSSVPDGFEATMQRSGAGQPLDEGTRSFMESRFGQDFGDVKVHTDGAAAEAAKQIQAQAFTTGRDIYFGRGRYQPLTIESSKLITHELAHVVQQSSSTGLIQGSDSSHDSYEVEADNAVTRIFGGEQVNQLTPISSGTIQKQKAPAVSPPQSAGQAAPPIVAINLQPTIAAQYPLLAMILDVADFAGLEIASERRYWLLNSTDKSKNQLPPSVENDAMAKTSVKVALENLLTPEAQFVDFDIWETFYGVVKAGGGDDLTGELARNEIMRRYFKDNKITITDSVQIELNDPQGKTRGRSQLRFVLNDREVSNSQGIIAPTDFVLAFGSLEPTISQVSNEANKIALAATLVLELEELEPLIDKLTTSDPKEQSLNEVRGVATRVRLDQGYVADFVKRNGPVPAETGGIDKRYQELQKKIDPAVLSAEKWHAENPAGESLGMLHEREGTRIAGEALKHWEKGGSGYIVGGLKFANAFLVAFVDAGEKFASMGFHDAATAVAQAYAQGDISWNEGNRVLYSAAWRALLTAAITRGLGAATSRLGVAAAGGIGIAARTTTFGVVSGGISGGLTGAGSVAAQALLTSRLENQFQSPAAQAIWNQGKPTGTDYLIGIGGGIFLGSLGGVRAVQASNAKLIGQIIDTPFGKMKVIAIDKLGQEILEPVGGQVKMPTTGLSGVKTIVVEPGWQPNRIAAPQLLPSGAGISSGEPIVLGPGEASLMVPPTVPTPTAGQTLVSGWLKGLKGGATASPSMLVSGYAAMKAPPSGFLLPGQSTPMLPGSSPLRQLMAPQYEDFSDLAPFMAQQFGTAYTSQLTWQVTPSGTVFAVPPLPNIPLYAPNYALPPGQFYAGQPRIPLLTGPLRENFTPFDVLPGRLPTTRTLNQIRNVSGGNKVSGTAAEVYIAEQSGGEREVTYNLPANLTRRTDVATAVLPGTLAQEVKNYLRYIGAGSTAREVDLTPFLQSEITRDAMIMYYYPNHQPVWVFTNAPPSARLVAALSAAGIPYTVMSDRLPFQ